VVQSDNATEPQGHPAQRGRAAAGEVEQAAGGRDDNVRPLGPQLAQLLAARGAAVEADRADAGACGEDVRLIADLRRALEQFRTGAGCAKRFSARLSCSNLRRQLARRRQHQHDRPLTVRRRRLRGGVDDGLSQSNKH
jgi:hypothetical protein